MEEMEKSEEIKRNIAKNLVAYRKQAHLTQAELAEKINYSDKAVSKWERAEGIPDVLVLCELAQLYGVTVNDFLIEHVEQPPQKTKGKSFWARRSSGACAPELSIIKDSKVLFLRSKVFPLRSKVLLHYLFSFAFSNLNVDALVGVNYAAAAEVEVNCVSLLNADTFYS